MALSMKYRNHRRLLDCADESYGNRNFEISEQFGIEVDDLRAPLDEEERSRIEVEDNYTLILADVPAIEERNEKDWYVTIPLGIIVTQKMIFTVCLEDTQVLTRFMEGRVRNFLPI